MYSTRLVQLSLITLGYYPLNSHAKIVTLLVMTQLVQAVTKQPLLITMAQEQQLTTYF